MILLKIFLRNLILIISLSFTSTLAIAAIDPVTKAASPLEAIEKDKNNPLGNKPYAEVVINSIECDYQVLINDIPIYSDQNAEDVIIPVNQYMDNSGTVLAIVTKTQDRVCNISTKLQIKHAGQSNEDALEITTLSLGNDPKYSRDDSTAAMKLIFDGNDFKQNKNGYIVINNPTFENGNVYYGYNEETKKRQYMDGTKISQIINLPINIPHWDWINGEKIKNNSKTKKEIIAIYEQIWSNIRLEDWSELRKMFAYKDKSLSKALYSRVDTVKSIREEINSNHYVKPLNSATIKYDVFINIYGDGKLADVTFADGDGILQFNTSPGTISYNVVFAKIDGEFKIVR
ncbi:hypothetical protein [Francisella frigiditurris]|uniref:Uncharacterized protein n=1 Tax=Francisella frigiditurris TaxID=1542390 RepID=A0A1J0KRH8_9GAMM|nr:hypothetical protein [Francisella frigiditurris]APC96361.1 hypothetical protein KX01_137 [Francisella frigiditurris]